uniref:Uncharacterized protein n=1 Tax=Glycine max TaxID=3847 RepID=A0A0R0FIA9_SOYBN
MDPVHVLNRSYLRVTVSPSSYYSRFFKSSSTTPNSVTTVTSPLTTQKRKEPRALKSTELLNALKALKSGSRCSKRECEGGQHSFVDLVQVAPQLEIRLVCNAAVLPAFNNLVANDTKDDAVAEILNNRYIMPQESCFYMSDLGQIRNLIPALTDSGFNLIVVDPPQENSSAHRKSRYISLQLIYEEVETCYLFCLGFSPWGVRNLAQLVFLSLPIKQLTHTEGALVALWVTNREKLRCFVKKNGSWICDLDLFHHRPYECLILGYSPRKVNNTDNQSKFKPVNNDHVIMSIPGDYSRKPPIADLLLEYVPGFKPSRCIELFAREIMAGWVAWGNEPLYFQDSKYFVKKIDQ